MEKPLQAIYTSGILRPLQALPLAEDEQVTLTITRDSSPFHDLAGFYTGEELEAALYDTITVEEVRDALAPIEGSLADAVIADRNER